MEAMSKEEIEIDLKELSYTLLKHIWIIVFSGLICALCAGIVIKIVIKPNYTSTTKLYVINRQNTEKATTYTDLQTGSQLTKDYKILVTSRPVTEQIISELELDMTHEEFVSAISVDIPTDTRILEITVKNKDPYIAKQLADAIGKVSAERMVSIMEMEKANIVEPGNIPVTSTRPSLLKSLIIGGLLGAVLASVVILIIYMLDDSIKSNDDIEKYLGVSTLAAIPFEENIMNSKKVRAVLKKAYRKGYRGGANNAVY